MVIQGRELGQFVIDFTWYLRNLLLLQSADNMEDVLDISSEHLELLKEEATLVKPETLMRFIHVFSQLSNQIKYSSQKRILIEIAIIKLCRPAMEQDLSGVLQRLDDLEKRVESGVYPAPSDVKAGTAQESAPKPERQRPELPKAVPEDVKELVQRWNQVLADLSGLTRNYLKQAHLSLGGGNVLQIVLEDTVAVAFLNEESRRAEILQAIEKNTGKQIDITIIANETGQPFGQAFADLEELIQMDIEIIEDDSEGGF
jgi:DNA polymerase-3 subunit gamma/tau